MIDIFDVYLTKRALKHLKNVPLHVALKLQGWIEDIGHCGLSEVKKTKGYHDEPLRGNRTGQRSIRLSKAYRAIYVIERNKTIRFVEIIEVHKHDY